MSITRSLSEVINKACELKTDEEKVAWLKENNTEPLRTLLQVMYDPINFVWNIPSESPPPYSPSPHNESHGMLYRQSRKLRYFIKGYDGDRLTQTRREFLFIEMLESIDKEDAKLMLKVLEQKPLKGLTAQVITEATGLVLPEPETKVKSKPKAKKEAENTNG